MKTIKILTFGILIIPYLANAGEIVQGFITPSFGGNPNNGPVLLNEANAINKYKAPSNTTSSSSSSSSSSDGSTSVSQFATTVDNLVQSAIASRLVTQALGPPPYRLIPLIPGLIPLPSRVLLQERKSLSLMI